MADAPSAAVGFGRLLRASRCAADLTQDELAALSGVGQSTLSGYESGNVEPSFSNAVAIATALKISVDDLAAPFRTPVRRRRRELAQVPA